MIWQDRLISSLQCARPSCTSRAGGHNEPETHAHRTLDEAWHVWQTAKILPKVVPDVENLVGRLVRARRARASVGEKD